MKEKDTLDRIKQDLQDYDSPMGSVFAAAPLVIINAPREGSTNVAPLEIRNLEKKAKRASLDPVLSGKFCLPFTVHPSPFKS